MGRWERFFGRAATLAAGLALTAVAPVGASAADQELKATYKIFFERVALANADLDLKVRNGAYAARVHMSPTGLGTVVTANRTSVTAAGSLSRGRVLPSRYEVDSSDMNMAVRVRMELDRGNVAAVQASPPLKLAPTRVPVTAAHKRGIVDPLSSGLMPYASRGDLGPRACNRTLEIFDGWTRYDVRLSYRRTEEVGVGDYQGKAVVCGARWVPVSGHRPEREAVKYLKANTGLEVSLIPLPGVDALIPYAIRLQTRYGVIRVVAETFDAAVSERRS